MTIIEYRFIKKSLLLVFHLENIVHSLVLLINENNINYSFTLILTVAEIKQVDFYC